MEQQSAKRARGRPRSVDKTDLLAAATETFWRLGYDGASLGELTKATGVSRPTLYAQFGDKDELFSEVVDYYLSTVTARSVEAFATTPDIRDAVHSFLRIALEEATRVGGPTGCLIASCAATAAENSPKLRERLRLNSAAATDYLTARFEAELEKGAVSDSLSPRARARLLGDFMRAQAVRARTGEIRNDLLADLNVHTSVIVGSG